MSRQLDRICELLKSPSNLEENIFDHLPITSYPYFSVVLLKMALSAESHKTNLHLHGAAVDELACGGDVVEDDGRLLAAVEHDALALARHPHRAPLAPEHVHRLVVPDLGDGNVLQV